jgi:hypothetical protein
VSGPHGAFERSLRDGPPDEAGYRPVAPDAAPWLEARDRALGQPRSAIQAQTTQVERVVGRPSVRRTQVTPIWQSLAAVLIVAVAIAGIGILGSGFRFSVSSPATASPTSLGPSPTPDGSVDSSAPPITVPPLSESFVSPRNGFSVRYPTGWTVTPATAAWPPNTFLPYGHSALDTLQLPGAPRVIVASQPLGAGQTAEAWLAAFFRPYEGSMAECAGDASTWPRLDIGGQTGYLDAAGCPVHADEKISERDVSFDALVFAGGRVYEFALDGDVDLDYFKAILATVELDPGHAKD